MSPLLQLMLALSLLLAAAKAGGLASRRLGQPSVLGELLVGVLLGPTFLNLLHIEALLLGPLRLPLFPVVAGAEELLPEVVQLLAELGVIFLMFYAGLEIHLEELLRSSRVALAAGVLGMVAPLALGTLVALPFGYDTQHALFIGVILTATSVSISAQTLMELGVLQSRPGLALLGAAVVDDVLGILVLSIFVALAASGGGGGGGLAVLVVVVRMVLFLAIATYLALWLLPGAARWASSLPISQGLLTFTVIVTLLFSFAAEALGGVAAITGAFLAGIALSRSALRGAIEEGMGALAYGFFVPLFFVSIGLRTDARVLTLEMVPLVLLVTLVAILAKIVGCGAGALWGGFARREALQLGIGMVSRGEVGLIVASVGLSAGIIGEEVFALAVIVVLLTTLVTPLLLRWSFATPEQPEARAGRTPEG